MKYTIIDGDKRTKFIQQDYDSPEEAEKRIEALKEKFADRFRLAVVQVDDAGNFHELNAAPSPAPSKQPTQQRHSNVKKERP